MGHAKVFWRAPPGGFPGPDAGLVLKLAVAVAKLVLGYATGAIGIVSDGFHSLTDSASNIIEAGGPARGEQAADADHLHADTASSRPSPRAPCFVFLIIAVMEIERAPRKRLASPRAAGDFVDQLRDHDRHADREHLGRPLQAGYGRRLSEAATTRPTRLHTRSDVFATIGVLISLTAVALGYPPAGSIGGVAIGSDRPHLMPKSPGHVRDPVGPCRHQRRRSAGGDERAGGAGLPSHPHARTPIIVFLDLHVWFPGDARLADAHALSRGEGPADGKMPAYRGCDHPIEPPPVESPDPDPSSRIAHPES
jgi:hypothetical protein